MAAPPPQLPPYPGFRPDLINIGGVQASPFPSQHQYPAGQPYPDQQYSGGHMYPNQYPLQPYPLSEQYPKPVGSEANQYPSAPGGAPGNYGVYGLPPTAEVSVNDGYKTEVVSGWSGFSNKAIRAAFIRKVYLILMVQLLFTLGVISLFVFHPKVRLFVRNNIMYYYISYFIFLGVYIALACCGNLRRKFPANMILLSIFTVCMSYMLGTISSRYETDVVLMTVGICAAVCLAVSIFSFHTKFDFTTCGGVLFILVWVLFIVGIISFFTWSRIMNTIYAACGALLFTAFLAYDTQMLMGGKKHEISSEEHIFAVMQIYLDICYIFMFLLSLIGSGRSD